MTPAMRIGVMLRHLSQVGGIYVYTTNLFGTLLEIDHKNKYFFFYHDVKQVGRYSQYPNVKERVINVPTKLLWDQIAIPWMVRREKLDLVFNPKLSVPIFTNAKTLFPLHGLEQFAVSEVFPLLDRIYFKTMMPFFCRRADAIISMTHLGVGEMKKYLGINPGKVYPIHESHHSRFKVLPREGLEGVRIKYGLPKKFLLFVGGINPLKNFSNILRAYQQIHSQVPHKLVAVGFKRWKFEEDLELIPLLGLQNHVIFTGFIPDEDLPAVYNLADALVFPSLYEGFGIPVLEAMACGCPVITTKTGCTSEVAGDAAILVDPRNLSEISGAIQRVISDTPLRVQMVQKGFSQASRFSWEKTARQTLDLMEKLVQSANER